MTNTELAILSLVAERPRHGYEIEQVIEERDMREWTEIGFSSIYYILKKLEARGLVTVRLEETKEGPARRVFSATQSGQQALRQGLLEILSIPEQAYPPLQLGLANLPRIPTVEALEALRRYQAALSERLAQEQSTWESKKPAPYFVDAMFDYSITMIQAEMSWIEKLIQLVETNHK